MVEWMGGMMDGWKQRRWHMEYESVATIGKVGAEMFLTPPLLS